MKKFACYVQCFSCHLKVACDDARAEGMRVIDAFKPGFCCWNSIALYGTPAQLARVRERWEKRGAASTHRKPKGAWAINVHIPEADWVDHGGAEYWPFCYLSECGQFVAFCVGQWHVIDREAGEVISWGVAGPFPPERSLVGWSNHGECKFEITIARHNTKEEVIPRMGNTIIGQEKVQFSKMVSHKKLTAVEREHIKRAAKLAGRE